MTSTLDLPGHWYYPTQNPKSLTVSQGQGQQLFPSTSPKSEIPYKLKVQMLAASNILHPPKYCSMKQNLFSLISVLFKMS